MKPNRLAPRSLNPVSGPSRLLPLAIILLSTVAFWQFGQGAFIYAKAQLAQWLLEGAWQQTLTGTPKVKPWSWADTYPVARLHVPSEGIDQIVLAGASGRTLAFGPGHLTASALPGEGGTAVFSGHRDTHFSFLRRLRRGEKLELELPDGRRIGYRVSDLRVADTRKSALSVTPGADALVLVTCYPFGVVAPSGPLRYVVTALPDTLADLP